MQAGGTHATLTESYSGGEDEQGPGAIYFGIIVGMPRMGIRKRSRTNEENAGASESGYLKPVAVVATRPPSAAHTGFHHVPDWPAFGRPAPAEYHEPSAFTQLRAGKGPRLAMLDRPSSPPGLTFADQVYNSQWLADAALYCEESDVCGYKSE